MRVLLAVAVVVDLLGAALGLGLRTGDADVVVGRPPARVRQGLPTSTILAPPDTAGTASSGGVGRPRTRPLGSLAEPASRPEMRRPDAQPYGPAIPFASDVETPDGLVFILIAGSDARPGERVDRSRADAIHLLAVNPKSGTGTLLGIPRDTYVEIPRHGRGKINTSMAIGGPDLLAETVQHLTGLPVDWWVVTSFDGLIAMVDALDGVVIEVDRRMADRNSGAYFERGYHHLAGREVLAFSRDRHDTAQGDFSRSANQGEVVLSALRKMRVEIGDVDGVGRWVKVLWDHVRIDAPFDEVMRLGSIARRLDPEQLSNVVAPGEVGTAGAQSVVYLTPDADRMFEDIRDDATIGDAPPPTTTTTTTPVTTSNNLTPRGPRDRARVPRDSGSRVGLNYMHVSDDSRMVDRSQVVDGAVLVQELRVRPPARTDRAVLPLVQVDARDLVVAIPVAPDLAARAERFSGRVGAGVSVGLRAAHIEIPDLRAEPVAAVVEATPQFFRADLNEPGRDVS